MIASSISEQISHYEAVITEGATDHNDIVNSYWWLGVSYALSNRLEDAEATWFVPIANANDDEELSQLNAALGDILLIAAQQQTELKNYVGALVLREYFQQLNDTYLENTLEIVLLRDGCDRLTAETPSDLKIGSVLALTAPDEIDMYLLSSAFAKLLIVINEDNADDILVCLKYSSEADELASSLVMKLLSETWNFPWRVGAKICEKGLIILPSNFDLLIYLSASYSALSRFKDSLSMSEKYYGACSTELQKIKGAYYLIGALLKNSKFDKISSLLLEQKILLNQCLIDISPDATLEDFYMTGIVSTMLFSYLQDTPQENHLSQNQLGKLYQFCINATEHSSNPNKILSSDPKKIGTIRIGYIANTLYRHSVGSLSRWIWQHHDREKFEIFTYCVRDLSNDSFNAKWFKEKSDGTRYFNAHAGEIAAQIKADKIDILIDLDSVTDPATYWVMCNKSAPVQITWLGWDSSGCPGVDYFIADPYVLPDNAQEYYSEKIWRLPETYLAVDGFEIGTPNLRRSDLGIEPDAIVYFNAQQGSKLNPVNIVPQMEIVRQVPNSYLLIKNQANPETTKELFKKLAEEVGLSFDRIRFIEPAPDEMTHRANLQIADVMLDTFPYNGATTTLETLWMGIPLVTMVGEQFVARNSYGFIMNAGITEGIAWTVEEYIDWGIRLGTDQNLRNSVKSKLRHSRQNSPLWNAKKFTAQMEQAYQDMWKIYQEKMHS
jgi:predicted O-linked N-acetylglucosamine transferase (SPINDLY family)